MIVTHAAPSDIRTEGAPVNAAGEPFRFVARTGHGMHYADTATEIVNVLIPGYIDLDAAESAQVLYDHAVRIATSLQTTQVTESDFDPAAEPEDVLTALMRGRDVPFTGLDDGSTRWDHPVALVVVNRHYEPFTDLVAPTGNVVVLSPSDEVSYLRSLSQIGYVQVFTYDDAVVPDPDAAA